MRVLLALGLLGFASLAQAQELKSDPPMMLKVSDDEAKLIAQTLSAISCPNVAQLIVCQQAADLLRSIREQAKAQGR